MKVVPIGSIDTDKFAGDLRRQIIDVEAKTVRLANFQNSAQAEDLSLPLNCNGFGRVHHFRRTVAADWPDNPLPIDPAKRYLGCVTQDIMLAQVFQTAGCSWRCWYCFVDDKLLSARPPGSRFFSAHELLDLYEQVPNRSSLIDLSGGQPDLVPEWPLWILDELNERKLTAGTFIWSDDNLSNDYLWRFLSPADIERLTSYQNYARVGCFKGFDEYSFSFNTRAKPEMFAKQFDVARRLIEVGIDLYGYVTLTSDDTQGISRKMRRFVDMLQKLVHPKFPLRIVPLRIFSFSPTRLRAGDAFDSALSSQACAVEAWLEEIDRRFSTAERDSPIFSHALH